MSSCLRVVHSTTVQQPLPIVIEKSYFLQLEQKRAEGSGAASGSPEAQPVHA